MDTDYTYFTNAF